MYTESVRTNWEVPPDNRRECLLEFVHYSDADRLWRAARTSGLLLIGAVLTIAIPIVHFFAPPVLLLMSIGFGVRNLRLERAAVAARGVCPACRTEVEPLLGGVRPHWPLWTTCPHCSERLRVLEPEGADDETGAA